MRYGYQLPITGKHDSRNTMTIVTHAYRPKRTRQPGEGA